MVIHLLSRDTRVVVGGDSRLLCLGVHPLTFGNELLHIVNWSFPGLDEVEKGRGVTSIAWSCNTPGNRVGSGCG